MTPDEVDSDDSVNALTDGISTVTMNGNSSSVFYPSIEQLESGARKVCEAAVAMVEHSYAPYSKFRVGAAIETECGKIITGCNVENASYGLAICAERTACVKAVSEGYQDFRRIAVYCEQLEDEFGVPCGACRQFLCEFNPEIPFYLVRRDRKVKETSLGVLLPDSFTPKRLKLHFHNDK